MLTSVPDVLLPETQTFHMPPSSFPGTPSTAHTDGEQRSGGQFLHGENYRTRNDNIYPQGIKETYDMMLLDMLMYKCMYTSHIQQMYMYMYTHTHTHSNEM